MELTQKDITLNEYFIDEVHFLTEKFAHEVYSDLQGEINPRLFDFLVMCKWIVWVRQN